MLKNKYKNQRIMKRQVFTLIALLGCIGTVDAQILDRVINKTKDKAKNKTEQKADQTIDKGLEKIEEGIGNIFKKKDKKEDSKTTSSNSKSTNKATSNDDNTDFSQYKGSTFIPGKNVLFFEDFSVARLGAGNTNWHLYEYDPSSDYERPNVKTISGTSGNWLKMPRKGFVFPNGFKNLPEQFTIEFDLYADPKKMNEMEGGFRTNIVAKDDREEYSIYWAAEPAVELEVHPHGSTDKVEISALSEYRSSISEKKTYMNEVYSAGWDAGEVNRVAITRNGTAVSMYLNGKEVINLPNGLPQKGKYNVIFSTNMWGDGMYVSNIRIAGDIVNASQEIKTVGKFVTNTIYFDTNSARIKPESWATLNNTAQAIKLTSDNYLIVGHTDSDGADDANLKLSQSRAASVKNALVKEFGIDASRLITDGKGESEPVASNNSTFGKAQNRRVEFIKQ
jgi:OOP family OmpA-OmpF porin